MEYTVQKLGQLAGVSTRTLRYYDEIGILKPARINTSGYRIYGRNEVDRLQQILFYRELGVGLDRIKQIVTAPDFDSVQALKQHRQGLLERRQQLDRLIANVDSSIALYEGGIPMRDADKFSGFKQKIVDDNEQQHGKEVREKYGDAVIDKANAKLMGLSEHDYATLTQLAKDVKATLAQAMETGDPTSDLAQKAAQLHKQWLMYYWSDYSAEAHAGLAQMYIDDDRFRAYYDDEKAGSAQFLRDAIRIFTNTSK